MIQWRRSLLWLAALVVAVAVCSTWMDPYLGIRSSFAAQAVNAALPVLLATLLWAMTGRPWFALLTTLGLVAVATFADHLKWRFLRTNLVFADLEILPTLAQDPQLVLGFVRASAARIFVIGGATIAAVVIALRVPWGRCTAWRLRLPVFLMAAAGATIAVGVQGSTMVPAVHWEVFSQASGAHQVGVIGNVLLGMRATKDVQRPVDPGAIAAFKQAPEVQAQLQASQAAASPLRPDIVVVQSESLFEPSELCGMPAAPVLSHLASTQSRASGRLDVPVFGGRTLQTEFEVLTGAPISFFNGSMFAYYELVDHSIDALPAELDRLGYRTMAIHPNARGFWRRDYVFPLLGFDTFIGEDAFLQRDFSARGHVSDDALMKAILSELDASTSPSFIFTITMDNHGPWGDYAPTAEIDRMLPAKLHGEARAQLADYLSRARDADQAWQTLIDGLSKRSRPTIVLLYGDHLPGLAPVYEELCFKDGMPPTSHLPPVQVWANFAIPDMPHETASYLLGGWLVHAAQLPVAGPMAYAESAALLSQDTGLSQPKREALLRDYANLAAENIYTPSKKTDAAGLAYVNRSTAQQFLDGHVAAAPNAHPPSIKNSDLVLGKGASLQEGIGFALNGRIATITLRPYLYDANGGASGTRLVVSGDGRTLWDSSVVAGTPTLATVSVAGVARLQIRAPDAPRTASPVLLRVAQMQCFARRCAKAGHLPAGFKPVASLVGPSVLAGPGATLDYLLDHEEDKRDGAAPIEATADDTLFMHSGLRHDAWIEFDASNLDSISLEPRIRPMDANCKAIPGAGTVIFSILEDGKVVRREQVAPGYGSEFDLKLRDIRRLRLSVNNAGDPSCDWFYVRFPSLTLTTTVSHPWWAFWR